MAQESGTQQPNTRQAKPGSRKRSDVLGSTFTWLSGGALAFNVLMIVGLLVLLAWQGMGYFWPTEISAVKLRDGTMHWGQLTERETARLESAEAFGKVVIKERRQLKVGNKRQLDEPFRWFDEDQIVETTAPKDLVLVERGEWGNFYGRLVRIKGVDGTVIADGDAAWHKLQELIEAKHVLRDKIVDIEKGILRYVNYDIADLEFEERTLDLPDNSLAADAKAKRKAKIAAERTKLRADNKGHVDDLQNLRKQLETEVAVFVTSNGQERDVSIGNIYRAIQPNDMSTSSRLGLYIVRCWEFIFDDPRESNTEGGIFPAIFGTVLMVFLMTVVVTPFGVLAALYLREYSKGGPIVRIVRIAVNNLAGVPSIVFGIFGLGFFVYLIGGTIDDLFFRASLPTPTYGTGGILWGALTLALLTVPVVIVATEEGLDAVPRIVREGSLALGATKFETIYKVVLPSAAPGILTGVILAVARAAGEVAPLMIVGMVKLADLPVDMRFPFLHPDRKFMHLGFHIYDVGFQSPDAEATQPLVYATALLLVVLVTVMNLVAIMLRNHLRKKYATSAV